MLQNFATTMSSLRRHPTTKRRTKAQLALRDRWAAVRRNWTSIAANGLTLAILAVALLSLRTMSLADLWATVPTQPQFWLCLTLFYFAGPAAEWLIYRRIWSIPATGIVPLLRKQVANELVLGYSGEVYFYSWARRHAALTGSPFGAIKDVAILSAMVGNVVTLALVALAAPIIVPFIDQQSFGLETSMLGWSFAVVILTTVVPMILGRRIFSLRIGDRWFISGVHLARTIIMIGLTAVLWHLALPHQPIIWWLILSVWRQLLSRLPFLPNKDVVFAAVAVFIIGPEPTIIALMTMMAGVLLAAHLIVGLGLVAAHIFTKDTA
jgi:hypothetical protein